jgi:hypothetical protein
VLLRAAWTKKGSGLRGTRPLLAQSGRAMLRSVRPMLPGELSITDVHYQGLELAYVNKLIVI